MEPIQFVVEDNKEQSLEDFAEVAIKFLNDNTRYEEVVRLADSITELKNDKMTRPDNIYPLPAGFHYRFSGVFGQAIGVLKGVHRETYRH